MENRKGTTAMSDSVRVGNGAIGAPKRSRLDVVGSRHALSDEMVG